MDMSQYVQQQLGQQSAQNAQIEQEIRNALALAEKGMKELRKEFAEYQKARLQTNNALFAGQARLPLNNAVAWVRWFRTADAPIAQKAATDLRELLRKLYKREPTDQELSAGPPMGDIVIPAPDPASLSFVVVIAALAWALVSMFQYLSTREQRIQREVGLPTPGGAGGGLGGLTPILLIGGGLGLGYYWWKTYQKPRMERQRTIGQRPTTSPLVGT